MTSTCTQYYKKTEPKQNWRPEPSHAVGADKKCGGGSLQLPAQEIVLACLMMEKRNQEGGEAGEGKGDGL